MSAKRWIACGAALSLAAAGAWGALPEPAENLIPFSIGFQPEVPGVVAASDLLHGPAQAVSVREGHFYAGGRRVRFWGVNFCFGGCFPTHAEADALAGRLARFGINAVRFHHMDHQAFPNGIFADTSLEALSPEALDRLDYFIAALKQQGIYADLNLHVSRSYARAQHWPHAEDTPEYDKMIDLFYPPLIEAEKRYARDLLTHVNAYTKTAYAQEPAVGVVELNNENSFFIWGGQQKVETLPEPYAGELQKQWNQWLAKKYATRAALAAAWNQQADPLGKNLLSDPSLATLGKAGSVWMSERHEKAQMSVSVLPEGGAQLKVTTPSDARWHLQVNQPHLAVKKGQYYTVRFHARGEKAGTIDVSVTQAHSPWQSLGLYSEVKLTPQEQAFEYGFTATQEDANARLSILVGEEANTITISDLQFAPGGQTGLKEEEDAARGTVERFSRSQRATAARQNDWLMFLAQTEEAYFSGMRAYLTQELKVKAPITGTIALGALGAEAQTKMDFVDAHAYWDHPEFPGRAWDGRNWLIRNRPMVDSPESAALWGLAGERAGGKPFTVTEYNHAAPNEYQAETIPLIASYAALQDWDGVFLFAYTHNNRYQKDHMESFFDIEGNPLKLAAMPLGSRIFLGGAMPPLANQRTVALERAEMLATTPTFYHELPKMLRQTRGQNWSDWLHNRVSIQFPGMGAAEAKAASAGGSAQWTAGEAGTGRYVASGTGAAVFVGFAGKGAVEAGPVRIEAVEAPFASILVVAADPKQRLEQADKLLIGVLGRGGNTDMKWLLNRRSVSNQWGKGPFLIEPVAATVSVPAKGKVTLYALDGNGQAGTGNEVQASGGRATLRLSAPTLWYELRR